MQSSGQIVTVKKPTPVFLHAGCPSCRPTNNVGALKGKLIVPCKGRIFRMLIILGVYWYNFTPATFVKARALKNNQGDCLSCLSGCYGTVLMWLISPLGWLSCWLDSCLVSHSELLSWDSQVLNNSRNEWNECDGVLIFTGVWSFLGWAEFNIGFLMVSLCSSCSMKNAISHANCALDWACEWHWMGSLMSLAHSSHCLDASVG